MALAIPCVACAIQWVFWSALQPFVWFLFFPAVFLSSRLGGMAGGLGATLLSAALVVYVFMPPQLSWQVANPTNLFSVVMFGGMGLLFSLTHARLREATKRITVLYERSKQLDELKSQLFANVSHELRTPLTLILGPIRRWLSEKPLTGDDRRDLEVVDRNARLLQQHISNLLDVSKVEAGRMGVRYSRENVAGLARFVASHFELLAGDRGITLDVRTPDALAAEVDAEKCRRILVNLISNAFKFTPDGGTVQVDVRDEGADVVFVVQDSGPGIPAEMREAVFERFRQIDGGPQRSHGGTGLGLAIVKEFVALQRGVVRVEDSPLGGASIWFRLPRAAPPGVEVSAAVPATTDEMDLLAPAETRGTAPAPQLPDAGLPLVLVVEDNADMAGYLARLLGPRCRVRLAHDGQAGLAAAEAERPDLILSDVMMPVMTGDQMVSRLRANPDLADVPVIMLTAKSDEALRVRMLGMGVTDYIDKPFSDAALVARVDAVIRETRRVRDQLRFGEERYRRLFDNMRNGLAYCRMYFDGDRPVDWMYLAVNRAFGELTGLTGVAGRRVSEVIPGIRELDPTLFETYGRVARTGQPAQFEMEVRALDQWFAVSAYCPEPEHFVAVFEVVTEQKRADTQIRQLSKAVEQSPATIMVTDAAGNIQYVNAKFTETTGYTFDEVKGRNPRILQSGQTPPAVYRALWETISAGDEWRGEFHNRRKQGDLFLESALISPIVDEGGRISGYLAVKEDITARRRLEEQLRHSQRLDAVGRLAGGVAHDFNNILSASMMHLGLLQLEPDLSPAIRRGLSEIEHETKRAADLTRQLLMFSRRSVLSVRPVAISDVIDGLLKMMRRLIGEDIDLRYDAGASVPSVNADPGMLEQVIVNMVVNARDAMPAGGRVSIRTGVTTIAPADASRHPEARPGTFVCVAVEDTGCGMDPATLARAFEPFFTTKEPGKGTGLGLATAHGIVAQHRGWIEVDSAPGRGTCFTVYLPASDADVEATHRDGPSEMPRGRGERVLLVEDEIDLRSSVARMLSSLGYTPFVAGSGQDALRSWATLGGDIDVVLTDVVMPEGISGMELVERLRVLKPGLRVIVSSGYSPDLVQAGGIEGPGTFYLPKPYGIGELARTLRACLDEPEASAPAPS